MWPVCIPSADWLAAANTLEMPLPAHYKAGFDLHMYTLYAETRSRPIYNVESCQISSRVIALTKLRDTQPIVTSALSRLAMR